jgi:hypothetical protein
MENNNVYITFIIPSIGRESLKQSIDSLIAQKDSDWNAIIIFDGINKNIDIIDIRIRYIEIEKIGDINKRNSAGLVRNIGFKNIENTKWIGFLDDDDTISEDYLEIFYKEIDLNELFDVLIFRMSLDDRIIPKLDAINFKLCDVGISFIIKYEIFSKGIKFIPNGIEDYALLNKIRENGYRIIISPYVKYFVRTESEKRKEFGNRVFINMDNPLITLFCYMMIYNKKLIQNKS